MLILPKLMRQKLIHRQKNSINKQGNKDNFTRVPILFGYSGGFNKSKTLVLIAKGIVALFELLCMPLRAT
jgi:hypothetical protein